MNKKQLGIIGCGDFLRWQLKSLKDSKFIEVAALYDLDRHRASQKAAQLGGPVVDDVASIYQNPEIEMVALFVPPWVRKEAFLQAAAAGKQIIATKPLASSVADCEAIVAAVRHAGGKAGVIYSRTEDPVIESLKTLFAEGHYGKPVLYRQDWLHAYPQWNNWATDPEKNGGPFMDAMIHNLNSACYLLEGSIRKTHFFSHNLSHPDLPCADTEAMVVEFSGQRLANLFITWAADLATLGTAGNDREHIDLFYLVTDQGWRITKEWREGGPVLLLSRKGQTDVVPCPAAAQTHYDAFAEHLHGAPFPRVLATLEEACRDVTLVRQKSSQPQP